MGGGEVIADGIKATAVGGNSNEATGLFSVVVGGEDVVASASTTASLGGKTHDIAGSYAVIVGNADSETNNQYGTVIGGFDNAVNGNYGAVIGGQGNTASGAYSLAVGGNTNSATDADEVAVPWVASATLADAFEEGIGGGYILPSSGPPCRRTTSSLESCPRQCEANSGRSARAHSWAADQSTLSPSRYRRMSAPVVSAESMALGVPTARRSRRRTRSSSTIGLRCPGRPEMVV